MRVDNIAQTRVILQLPGSSSGKLVCGMVFDSFKLFV